MTDLYYLDASAWVKRYLTEAGSAAMKAIFENQSSLAGTMLGYIEVAATIARRTPFGLEQRLARLLSEDWNSMFQHELRPEILGRAAGLARQHRLKGADAIHLASALTLQDGPAAQTLHITMLTADQELGHAAQLCGLQVLNPPELHVI